jgi:hypothetical protein
MKRCLQKYCPALGLAIAVGSYLVAPAAAAPQLEDINRHWGRLYISGLVDRGIVGGFPDGTFRPNEPVSRSQFAVIVAQAFQLTADKPAVASGAGTQSAAPKFADDLPDWAAPAIQAAATAGIVSGFTDGTFRPYEELTRAQAIAILTEASRVTAVEPNRVEPLLERFADRDDIPNWARTSIATATQEGMLILFPKPNRLDPNTTATRGEIAALTYLALVRAAKAPAVSIPAGAVIPNSELSKVRLTSAGEPDLAQ